MKVSTEEGSYTIYGAPNSCPYCHKSIHPIVLGAHESASTLEVFMYCPNSNCNSSFIAYYYINAFGYDFPAAEYLDKTNFGNITTQLFSETINGISTQFEKVYNQSYAAEQYGLKEICGGGYRKALEFLMKDYAISKNPNDKIKVENAFLGDVIKNYVKDERIKKVAKRAAWLGNDETHYLRKWIEKDIEDLKKLISLTVHWIEMEALTATFEIDMPD